MNLGTPIPQEAQPSRDLDSMDVERVARGIVAYHPPVGSIRPLLDRAAGDIPGLSHYETVLRVYGHNPDCLFALARSDGTAETFDNPAGFIAQLPLNAAGAEALFDGSLDTANPDLRFVCRQHERPAALYIWAIYVSHRLAGGIALIMERLSSSKNKTAPLYCKATSEKSWSFFLSLGFSPGVLHKGKFLSDLMEYRRSVKTEGNPPERPSVALYDSLRDATRALPRGADIGVTAVHTFDDLLKVFSIRAATYIAEQDCPYTEEFDGNDLTGTHLIGYVGNEPAGCIRIRYFAEFAKLERLAVLPKYRRSRLAMQLIKAAIEFCRKKGYRRLYGHAEPRVLKLWEHFGFRPRTAEPTFSFSELEFLEGDLELAPSPDALTSASDPYVLIRPEGQWDRPGVLDKSASRSAPCAT
jgi:predicted GNAT family N-acyltransferase